MSHHLQHLMHRAVRDVADTDPGRLAHEARRRGLGIRRRRQALGLVGMAAAAALALGGIEVVRGIGLGEAGGAAGQTDSSELVAATGETTATALVEELAQVADGTVVRVAGSSHPLGRDQTSAQVWWRPADGSGDSVIGITVRAVRPWEHRLDPCADGSECGSLPMGQTTFETLREQTRPEAGHVIRVATHERADDVRVTLTSTNGRMLDDGTWQQSRPLPLLDRRQLQTIVESSTFGLRTDPALSDPGRVPHDYEDLDRSDPAWARLNPAG